MMKLLGESLPQPESLRPIYRSTIAGWPRREGGCVHISQCNPPCCQGVQACDKVLFFYSVWLVNSMCHIIQKWKRRVTDTMPMERLCTYSWVNLNLHYITDDAVYICNWRGLIWCKNTCGSIGKEISTEQKFH